jgi:hypothetical protein
VGASAQGLADELGTIADLNSRLYATQRTVAQTLQQSLLPQRLPEIAGLVSGRGLGAATVTSRPWCVCARRHRSPRGRIIEANGLSGVLHLET